MKMPCRLTYPAEKAVSALQWATSRCSSRNELPFWEAGVSARQLCAYENGTTWLLQAWAFNSCSLCHSFGSDIQVFQTLIGLVVLTNILCVFQRLCCTKQEEIAPELFRSFLGTTICNEDRCSCHWSEENCPIFWLRFGRNTRKSRKYDNMADAYGTEGTWSWTLGGKNAPIVADHAIG